jgi:hypothetical protein
MYFQEAVNIALGIISASLGWFARELWTAVKDLKEDIAKIREDLPINYVRKDDFKSLQHEISEFRKEMIRYLEKIGDTLNLKADK